jgi:electron transport complex protein RnfE
MLSDRVGGKTLIVIGLVLLAASDLLAARFMVDTKGRDLILPFVIMGFGMGLAVTFVLVGSNVLISLLRKVIPKNVRIACFIVVVATFVIVVELLMQAYTYELFLRMGIFIPLIVVNCIPLGRAEAFCYKKGVLPSLADGLGMGLGYTISLTVLAIIREVLGNGTFFNQPISFLGPNFQPYAFMITAPGAFVLFWVSCSAS